MPRNIERAIELIRLGLETQARQQLADQKAIRTGALRDSIDVFVENGDDFIIEFLDYGVFVDQGTRYVDPRPFYSNLIVDENEGILTEEVSDILEDAFDEDVAELDNIDFNT